MTSSLRHSDALAVTRFLATAGLVLSVLGLVSGVSFLAMAAVVEGPGELSVGVPVRVGAATGPVTFDGPEGPARQALYQQLREETFALGELQGNLGVPVDSPVSAGALLLAIAWAGGLAITFFRLLRALLGDAREGRPFTVENAGRVRDLGYVVLAFTVGGWLWRLVGGLRLSGRRFGDLLEVRPLLEINAPAVLAGLLLLALAAVWRHGVEMEEERRALEAESQLTV